MFSTVPVLLSYFQLENNGPEMHGLYSFAVIAEGKEFLLAASSEEEKYKWVEVRIKNTNFSAIVVQDQMFPRTTSSSVFITLYITYYIINTALKTLTTINMTRILYTATREILCRCL